MECRPPQDERPLVPRLGRGPTPSYRRRAPTPIREWGFSMDRDSIGYRVARWRNVAGLTQEQLAAAAGISREQVSRIENGRRAVDKRSTVIALAYALKVDVPQLLGEPRPPTSRDDLVVAAAVARIRVALDDVPPTETRSADMLWEAAGAVAHARVACDYSTLADLGPAVLAEAPAVASSTSGREQELALRAMVKAAVYSTFWLKTSGYQDLALRVAERGLAAATSSGRPVDIAAARMAVCQALMSAGIRHRAHALAVQGATDVADLVDGDDDAAGRYVDLHLQSAVCAASLDDYAGALDHLDEAARVADRLGVDPWTYDDWSTDVAIWRVGVALEEAADPEAAPDLAARVDRSLIRTPQRLARLMMDVGRGWFARGDHRRATGAFLAAHDAAQGEVRARNVVREIVGQMVRDSPVRGGNGELRSLAHRLAVNVT